MHVVVRDVKGVGLAVFGGMVHQRAANPHDASAKRHDVDFADHRRSGLADARQHCRHALAGDSAPVFFARSEGGAGVADD
jgi:hypothetical protein